MPIIQFGPFVGASYSVVPKFGADCVCCNGETMWRTQEYDPSTDRVTAPAITIPVCFECRKHALRTHTATIMIVSLLGVGIPASLLAYSKLSERPSDEFLWWTIGVGISAIVVAIAWLVVAQVRETRYRRGGHNAGLSLTVGEGPTILTTTNETLASTLLDLNPGAKRKWTRAERRRFPHARAVGEPDAEEDAEEDIND